eukprot:IDg13217t1
MASISGRSERVPKVRPGEFRLNVGMPWCTAYQISANVKRNVYKREFNGETKNGSLLCYEIISILSIVYAYRRIILNCTPVGDLPLIKYDRSRDIRLYYLRLLDLAFSAFFRNSTYSNQNHSYLENNMTIQSITNDHRLREHLKSQRREASATLFVSFRYAESPFLSGCFFIFCQSLYGAYKTVTAAVVPIMARSRKETKCVTPLYEQTLRWRSVQALFFRDTNGAGPVILPLREKSTTIIADLSQILGRVTYFSSTALLCRP